MLKTLFLCTIVLCAGLTKAMEVRTGLAEAEDKEFRNILAIFLPKKQANESVELENIVCSHGEVDNQCQQNISWDILPEELKLYIVSFIPKMGYYESIKNLLLVNHSFNDLIFSSTFLKTFALEIVKHNPTKAVDAYAWAMERQNMLLAEYILKYYLIERVELKEMSEKNVALSVIISMIKHNVEAARRIFCAAAEQGNKALINLFISAKSNQELHDSQTTVFGKYKASLSEAFFVPLGIGSFSFRAKGGLWYSKDWLLGCYGQGTESPLKRAAVYNHKDVIELLVKTGIVFDFKDAIADAVLKNDWQMEFFLISMQDLKRAERNLKIG